jgi:hypothetical protein
MTHPTDSTKIASDGRSRLARGLAALVEAQERRPRTPAEACVLRGLEAMLGVRKLRQVVRKPTLASVAKQASKAAIPVARYEMKPDGTVVIVTGQGEQQRNEVDEWIAKHARAPERH